MTDTIAILLTTDAWTSPQPTPVFGDFWPAAFAALDHAATCTPGPSRCVLPNAWDVGSALAFADAGFPAVGTTSFGVGAAAGRPTVNSAASRDATRELVQQLAQLPVPVSADVEDGYDDDPGAVAAFVASLPVAGINLEDSTDGLLVATRVLAARSRRHAGVPADVFVTAPSPRRGSRRPAARPR